MYVILDRALPHLGDGLKPVQRRIIYAMSELGLAAGAKHKKSARTVGDVIGKFHPHGDSACYEAMVHMAQDFAYRYPDHRRPGQLGIDRRSEVLRGDALHRVAADPLCRRCCCEELGSSTVDWAPNFDGSHGGADDAAGAGAEPAAERRLGDRGRHGDRHSAAQSARGGRMRAWRCSTIRSSRTRKLMAHVKGPDLPTGGEIVSPRADLVQMYETGTGSFKARATYEVEDGEIVIDALPFQVSGSKMLEQIARADAAEKAADGR